MKKYLYLTIFAFLFSCSAEIESPEAFLDEIFSVGGNSSPSGEPLPTDKLPESGHYGYYVSELTFTLPEDVYCDNTGAAPTESSPMKPGSTHTFTQTTILRCAHILDSKSSPPVMRTYLFGRVPTLPIVSIAADPTDFSREYGKITNLDKEYDFELPIHVDFFERGKIGNLPLAWSYPAELGPMGSASRQYQKKSVSVSFKEKYGQKNLKYRLFPDAPLPVQLKYKHFVLRNNGNNYENDDYIRDMLMTSLTDAQFGETPAKGLDIDYQKGRAVVVYYNGQYYGIHNMRERSNSDWFETNYNIDENNVNLLKINYKIKPDFMEVSRGSLDGYKNDVIGWLEGVSLTNEANMKTLESRIDLDNFTNHFQSRIFYNDADWPGNNIKVWRSNSPQAKWRFFMYDTDHGFDSWGSSCAINPYDMLKMVAKETSNRSCGYPVPEPNWPNPPNSTIILRKLLENENYKRAFINRFSLLIATYFNSRRTLARIDELRGDVANEISYDRQRWFSNNYNYPILPFNTITSFASTRPSAMQEGIEQFFNLTTPVDLTLSATGGGTVSVHGLQVLNNKATFKVYPTVPITLKAEGAGFKGWSDGGTAAERTETITSAKTLTAKF